MPDDVIPAVENQEAVALVSVRPGTKCVLIGIEGLRPSRHNPRKGRHRFGQGGFESETGDECSFRHSKRDRGRGMMRRLMDLGITKGCTFTVVQSGGHGPVLIEVRGTRIALGHHMACRILVREVT